MVHGDCSSRGCYAMTDEQIAEIYALARESFFGGQHVVPDSGLSVPDDGAEHGQAPQQPALGVLEDAQAGQRPFRGDAARAQSRRVRQALRVRRRAAGDPSRPLRFNASAAVPGLPGEPGSASTRSPRSSATTTQFADLVGAARRRSRCAPAATAACTRRSSPSWRRKRARSRRHGALRGRSGTVAAESLGSYVVDRTRTIPTPRRPQTGSVLATGPRSAPVMSLASAESRPAPQPRRRRPNWKARLAACSRRAWGCGSERAGRSDAGAERGRRAPQTAPPRLRRRRSRRARPLRRSRQPRTASTVRTSAAGSPRS